MQFQCSPTPSHRIIYRQSIYKHLKLIAKMERAMRFELTTSTLARLRSTPELRPPKILRLKVADNRLAEQLCKRTSVAS